MQEDERIAQVVIWGLSRTNFLDWYAHTLNITLSAALNVSVEELETPLYFHDEVSEK